MKREIILTKDGSSSIFLPEWNETYHSKFGAIQEAKHVFIINGLDIIQKDTVSILEMGLGTGLNAFITLLEAEKKAIKINYVGVEAYPVTMEEIQKMNYPKQLEAEDQKHIFIAMHQAAWEKEIQLSNYFNITKREQFFDTITDEKAFDLIYFDAFGFDVQPELWTETLFQKMYEALKPRGILVTYACRTVIKNAMKTVGFTVEKLPGAPGKREMLRASKSIQV